MAIPAFVLDAPSTPTTEEAPASEAKVELTPAQLQEVIASAVAAALGASAPKAKAPKAPKAAAPKPRRSLEELTEIRRRCLEAAGVKGYAATPRRHPNWDARQAYCLFYRCCHAVAKISWIV